MKKLIITFGAVIFGLTNIWADWSTYRGDQARSGYNADSTISTSNLTSSWSTKISSSFINTSQPIIDNGYAYVGTGEGKIVKIVIATGSIVPEFFTANGPITSTGLIKDGVLYIGSLDGNMYAINTSTMDMIWSVKATAGISTSPLYIQATPTNKIVFIDNSGSIFKVNASDGTGIVQLDSNDYIASSSALNDKIVITASSGKVYIVEKDITALNAFYLDASSVINPIIKNSSQFYTGDISGKINLMDTSGNIISTLNTGNQIISPGTFDGSNFAISDVNETAGNSTLYLTNSDLTPIAGSTPVVKDKEFIAGNVMSTNNILSISDTGKIGFYDKATGAYTLLANLNKSINAAPVIGNFVLVSDSEGILHCWLGPTPDYSPTPTFEGTFSPTPTITATATSTEFISYTPTPTMTTGPTTIRINCGGSDYTDTDSNVWQADTPYSAGAWGYTGYSNVISTTSTIAGTSNPALYQDIRWENSFGYKFDLENGIYKITFKFAEILKDQVGQRNFKILVNGNAAVDKYNINNLIGTFAAIDQLYEIQVTAGQLVIQLSGVSTTDNASIAGIMVEKITAFSTPTPTITPSTTMTITNTYTITLTSTYTYTPTFTETSTITNTVTLTPTPISTVWQYIALTSEFNSVVSNGWNSLYAGSSSCPGGVCGNGLYKVDYNSTAQTSLIHNLNNYLELKIDTSNVATVLWGAHSNGHLYKIVNPQSTPTITDVFNVTMYCDDVEIDRTNNQKMILATEYGLYRSVDGGLNWVRAATNDTYTKYTHIKQSPYDSDVYYAVLWQGLPGGICKYRWSTNTIELLGLYGLNTVSMALDCEQPGNFFALISNGDIYYYNSVNSQFNKLAVSVPGSGFREIWKACCSSPAVMYAFNASNGGMYRSIDNAASWQLYNSGLTSVGPRAGDINCDTNEFLLATTNGIWKNSLAYGMPTSGPTVIQFTYTATSTVTITNTSTATFTSTSTPTITPTNTPRIIDIAWSQPAGDSENTGYSPLAGHNDATDTGERYRLIAPNSPDYLISDNAKNIYIVTRNGSSANLYKIGDDGSSQYIVSEDIGNGIALGLFNHLYYPEFNTQGTQPFVGLHAIDIADGTVNWTQHIPIFDWNLQGIFVQSGLRVDKNGQIYFAASGSGLKKIIDNKTSAQDYWGSTNVGGNDCWTNFQTIIDSNGFVYLLRPVSQNCPSSVTGLKLVKYAPDGTLVNELILDSQDSIARGLLLDESNGLIYVKKRDIQNNIEDIYIVVDSGLNGVIDTIRTGIYNDSGPMGALYKQTGEFFFVGDITQENLGGYSAQWFPGHEGNDKHGLFSYYKNSTSANKVTLRYFTGYHGTGTAADNIANINTNIIVDSYGKVYFGTDKEFYIVQKGNMIPISRHFEDGTKANIVIGADNRVYYTVNNTIVCLAPGGAIIPPSGGVPPKPSVSYIKFSIGPIKITIKITTPGVGKTNYYLSGSPYTKLNDEPVEGDTFEFDPSILTPGKEYSIICTSVDEYDQESEPSDPIIFVFGTPTVTETQTPEDTYTDTPTPTLTGTVTITPTITCTPTITETFTPTTTSTMAISLLFKSGDTNLGSNSPHPMFRLINNDARTLDLSKIELRYWYRYEGTGQQETDIVDYAGKLPAGTNITGNTHLQTITGNFDVAQNRYLSITFDSIADGVTAGGYVDVDTRFNKSDWSAYDQSNDWSYVNNTNYQTWSNVTAYYDGVRIWGNEPSYPTPTITITSSATQTPTATYTPFIDMYEPDNDYSSANVINNGQTQAHSIDPAYESDWVKFTVDQPSEVIINTSGDPDIYVDTVIFLYDSTGVINDQFITTDDDGGGELYSKIDTTLNPGMYFVKIVSYSDPIYKYYVTLNINPLPTATPTLTTTLTATITPLDTETSTGTATPLPTFTSTVTCTYSDTPTFTDTSTVTATYTESSTPSFTVTPTITQTATQTFTPTYTSSFTQTITNTNTPTITPSYSSTITNTYTATVTPTKTSTNTQTPSITTTFTLTQTFTRTITPTFSISPTATQGTASVTLMYKSTDNNQNTNSPHPLFRLYNNATSSLALSRVEIRYWYKFEGTNQSEQTALDYAGRLPSGTNIQGTTHLTIVTGSFGDQDRYLKVTFDSGAGSLAQNDYTEIQTRFNKSDWSSYNQSNDFSYANYSNFTNWSNVTVYIDGTLVWGSVPVGVASISKKPAGPAAPLAEDNVYNYPNPFSGSTTIRFSLDHVSDVQVNIYDVNDKPVWSKVFEAGSIHEGINYFIWDSSNDKGITVGNGVYLLEIKAGDRTVTKKIVVIR
jgi:hypothetical protein